MTGFIDRSLILQISTILLSISATVPSNRKRFLNAATKKKRFLDTRHQPYKFRNEDDEEQKKNEQIVQHTITNQCVLWNIVVFPLILFIR